MSSGEGLQHRQRRRARHRYGVLPRDPAVRARGALLRPVPRGLRPHRPAGPGSVRDDGRTDGLGPRRGPIRRAGIRPHRQAGGRTVERRDGTGFREDLLAVDSALFGVFSFDLLRGDPRTALARRTGSSSPRRPPRRLRHGRLDGPLADDPRRRDADVHRHRSPARRARHLARRLLPARLVQARRGLLQPHRELADELALHVPAPR